MSSTVPLRSSLLAPGADRPAVAVARVSVQPRCDTGMVSILVPNFVAVAASVENMKITVRKSV